MKPENRKAYLDKSKTDWHIHEDNKKVLNWWEDEITIGNGTIKTRIRDEIDDGVDEYFEEKQKVINKYNVLILLNQKL